MPSLYARYIKEREGREIIEDSRGFATYSFHDDGKICYIVDIYVLPEYRNRGVASAFADKIVEIARLQGAEILLGSVDPEAIGAEASRDVLTAYGMKRTDKKLGKLELYIKEIV